MEQAKAIGLLVPMLKGRAAEQKMIRIEDAGQIPDNRHTHAPSGPTVPNNRQNTGRNTGNGQRDNYSS